MQKRTEKVRPGGSACDAFAWSAAGREERNGSGRRSTPLWHVACRRPWVVVG